MRNYLVCHCEPDSVRLAKTVMFLRAFVMGGKRTNDKRKKTPQSGAFLLLMLVWIMLDVFS